MSAIPIQDSQAIRTSHRSVPEMDRPHGVVLVAKNLAKNLATIAALQCLLLITIPITLAALLVRWLRPGGDPYDQKPDDRPPTVLISGGKMSKSLQLARSFKRDGYRVILCETPAYAVTAHRFSRCVDLFVTTPQSDAPDYAARIAEIVDHEGVDHYVPVCSPVASRPDSLARKTLDAKCNVVHPTPDSIEMLDNKFQLAQAAHAIGLGACQSHWITDAREVLEFDFASQRRNYILKSIAYDSVRRLDLTPLPRPTFDETRSFVACLPISMQSPWVLQEFIAGKEYCTHSTVRNGELRLHICCESSACQVNYDSIDDREIEDWVRRFVSHYRLDGQISFDFMRADDDGKIYVIECNPRTHSAITAMHDHPGVAKAYLSDEPQTETIRPLESSKPTYWMAHELWRIVTQLHRPAKVWQRLKVIAVGKDAVLDWYDPVPFFMLHHFHIPMLLLRDIRERRGWIRIDFNIGKLVQLGGD